MLCTSPREEIPQYSRLFPGIPGCSVTGRPPLKQLTGVPPVSADVQLRQREVMSDNFPEPVYQMVSISHYNEHTTLN